MLDYVTSTDAFKYSLVSTRLWEAYGAVSRAVLAGRTLSEMDIARIEGEIVRSLDAVVTSDLPPVVDGVQAVSGARHWLGEAFQELRAAREKAAGKAPDM